MPIKLSDIVKALPSDDTWGPPTTTDSLIDGVPYAAYSKGDRLNRMADWTTEGKDRDGRGGRQQYNRNYRGTYNITMYTICVSDQYMQTNKSTARGHRPFSQSK